MQWTTPFTSTRFPPLMSGFLMVLYLFEANTALAEEKAGAGVNLDHLLPFFLGLGGVVEPAPHRVAPVGQAPRQDVKVPAQRPPQLHSQHYTAHL